MKYSTRVIVIVVFGAYILLMLWLLFGQRLEYYDIPGTYWEKVQYSLNLIPGQRSMILSRYCQEWTIRI